MNIRTAQKYIRQCYDDEERRLPVMTESQELDVKAKLTDSHSQFPMGYVDEHPEATLSDIRRAQCEAFSDLSISIFHGIQYTCTSVMRAFFGQSQNEFRSYRRSKKYATLSLTMADQG
jgi:hypothetical protein